MSLIEILLLLYPFFVVFGLYLNRKVFQYRVNKLMEEKRLDPKKIIEYRLDSLKSDFQCSTMFTLIPYFNMILCIIILIVAFVHYISERTFKDINTDHEK